MWLFGKRLNIKKAARGEEESSCPEDLPVFAPEIETGISEYTEPEVQSEIADELPTFDEDEERPFTMPASDSFLEETEDEEAEEVADEGEDSAREEQALIVPEEQAEELSEEQVEEQPEDVEEEEAEEPRIYEEGESPAEIYEELRDLPYASRTYGLLEDRMLLVHPDGLGGLFLFEEYGDYQVASPDKCKLFVRLKGLKGRFKGKNYATADFEYVIKNRAWPLMVLATNKNQYRSAIDQGYKPYKTAPDGKGMLLCKDISLYRIKDLTLRVELTLPTPVLTTAEYLVNLQRTDLEEVDCEKQFKKLCRRVGEYLHEQSGEALFTAQVLKVAKNLVVCFPLEGVAQKGDRFGGDVITAVAPASDGTLILQIGSEQNVRLPLEAGGAYKGQHLLALPTE